MVTMKVIEFLLIILCILESAKCANSDFNVIYKWKQLTYDNLTHKESDIVGGSEYYIAKNNIPTGLSHSCRRNRVFIGVARRAEGIPSTLNYIDISLINNEVTPALKSFPNYKMNELKADLKADPNRIISVYRPTVDVNCNRLWFVDTGLLEYPAGSKTVVQKPSIWVYDIRDDSFIRRYEIPDDLAGIPEGLVSITIDSPTQSRRCNEAFAYISNTKSNRLIVYSFKEDDAWAFENDFMKPVMSYANLEIDNVHTTYLDGIFSTALGERVENDRPFMKLYFHPLASTKEYYVSTKVLKNKRLAPTLYSDDDFQEIGNRGEKSQSTIHDYDRRTSVIFFAEAQTNSIRCWNTKDPLMASNIGLVYSNKEILMFPSDLEVDCRSNVWILSNRLPLLENEALDVDDYNFHVIRGPASAAIKSTVCQQTRG